MHKKPCDPATFGRIDPAVTAAINAAIVDPTNPKDVPTVLRELAEVLSYEAGIMLAGLCEIGAVDNERRAQLVAAMWVILSDASLIRREPKERYSLDVFRAMLPK